VKIKVTVPVETWQDGVSLSRVVEVEIDDEQMKALAQEVAAQLRLYLTGGILPPSEQFPTVSTGTGIEYLRRQPTSK
jgi:hypothetical protein